MAKVLWTDGSADPNPGAGGYAVLEQMDNNQIIPVVLGSEPQSTNIRMEGQAIVAAMEYAGAEGCEIHTDSEFWVNVVTKWSETWRLRGWKKSGGPIKNLDIVKKAYWLYNKYPVEFIWVKGHANIRFNEEADRWANRARLGATVDDPAKKLTAKDVFSPEI